MGNPYVREVGSIEDDNGCCQLTIGIEYGTVTLTQDGPGPFRLDSRKTEEFQQLFVSACWQAAVNLVPSELAELTAAALDALGGSGG
jgi:hypothetical protein